MQTATEREATRSPTEMNLATSVEALTALVQEQEDKIGRLLRRVKDLEERADGAGRRGEGRQTSGPPIRRRRNRPSNRRSIVKRSNVATNRASGQGSGSMRRSDKIVMVVPRTFSWSWTELSGGHEEERNVVSGQSAGTTRFHTLRAARLFDMLAESIHGARYCVRAQRRDFSINNDVLWTVIYIRCESQLCRGVYWNRNHAERMLGEIRRNSGFKEDGKLMKVHVKACTCNFPSRTQS